MIMVRKFRKQSDPFPVGVLGIVGVLNTNTYGLIWLLIRHSVYT